MNQLNNRLNTADANSIMRDALSDKSVVLRSESLLAGQDSLRILHQNETYILRKTRAGKLILTK